MVRPGVIWGPGDTTFLPRFAALLRPGQMVLIDGGRNLLGLSHVENLAQGMILAATVPAAAGQIYHLTDGEEITAAEVFRLLAAALGVPPPRRSLPFPPPCAAAALMEAWRQAAAAGRPARVHPLRRAPGRLRLSLRHRQGPARAGLPADADVPPGGRRPGRGEAMTHERDRKKIRIESLGVYLPEKVLTMEELLASCRRRPRWDLERITGIRERRVAVGEYAVDLAVQAARRALAMSRYRAADLDVIVCTSISKHNRENEFQLEPATAVLHRAGPSAPDTARVFDVVNACAGMLTGIYVLQGLIRSGAGPLRHGGQRRAQHAGGRTAARELRHSFDGQMAALTLGDGGAAVILDASPDPAAGFQQLDLVTGAKHDHYCYSRPSRRGRGRHPGHQGRAACSARATSTSRPT